MEEYTLNLTDVVILLCIFWLSVFKQILFLNDSFEILNCDFMYSTFSFAGF